MKRIEQTRNRGPRPTRGVAQSRRPYLLSTRESTLFDLVIISISEQPEEYDAALAKTSNLSFLRFSRTIKRPESASNSSLHCSSNVLLLISVKRRVRSRSIQAEKTQPMVVPYTLRPDIRERIAPQVSAYALAEYIIADPSQQENILHNSRFLSATFIPKNQDVVRTIQAYSTNVSRDPQTVRKVIEAQRQKSNSSLFSPSQRDEAARCVEGLELFLRGKQAFGVDGIALIESPRFESVEINGTLVSVQPAMLAGTEYPPAQSKKVGTIFVRPQKNPNPDAYRREATKAAKRRYREEAAKYMLVISKLALISQGLLPEQFDKKKSAVWDLRLQSRVPFPSDWVSREKQVLSAAGQIARLWNTVPPKKSDLAN